MVYVADIVQHSNSGPVDWTVPFVYRIATNAFATIAVWVPIVGALIIRHLVRLLNEEHEEKQRRLGIHTTPNEENGGA